MRAGVVAAVAVVAIGIGLLAGGDGAGDGVGVADDGRAPDAGFAGDVADLIVAVALLGVAAAEHGTGDQAVAGACLGPLAFRCLASVPRLVIALQAFSGCVRRLAWLSVPRPTAAHLLRRLAECVFCFFRTCGAIKIAPYSLRVTAFTVLDFHILGLNTLA